MLQTLALARLDGWSPPAAAPPPPAGGDASGLELIAIPGARVPIGAAEDGFAYDNERPRHEVEIDAFALGRSPVTNADWLEFIEAGGYARREIWSEEGWAWRRSEAIERPLNWLDGARERRLDGVHALEPGAPVVHVSWYEADAFARSHGMRLPSEFEWELAATWDFAGSRKLEWPWGDAPPTAARANLIEASHFAPLPAGSLPDGAAPCGALAMIGDVWEWTSSEFRGYPGFEAHPYREYSEVFFGPVYRVLRGGSFAASGTVATPTFRNWDYPQRRQIFAGLRVAAGSR
jgi:gamma-glutamyl hercynylcysteine S-oxide synthase